MANSSKKRRVSESPHRIDAKRTRRVSSSASVRSQQKSASQQPTRTKSVFRGDRDPYLPTRDNNAKFLPTSDDWAFRVKVISSSTDLHNDVFKRAIQGLVKICFPEGVLEELGIQVLEEHMRHENAPKENIIKMTEIFRSEMVHRVVWMLAEYLDTPAKVDATVSSIMAASARLHGGKVGDDVLGYVMSSLNDLRSRVPSNSTELLTNGVGIMEPEDDNTTLDSGASTITEDDAASSSDESSEKEPAPPPKKGKKRKNEKSRKQAHDRDNTTQGTSTMEVDTSATPLESIIQSREEQPPGDKERKISSTWRWDVNPKDLNHEILLQIFKCTSDLFAFHALPIAHERLGSEPKPKRRQLQEDIQSMFNGIGDEEYTKWKESLQKLHSGDMKMLDRTKPSSDNQRRNTTTTTRAPITRTRLGSSNLRDRQQETTSLPVPNKPSIKREVIANKDAVVETVEYEAQLQKDQNASTGASFWGLATEKITASFEKKGLHAASGGDGPRTEAEASQKLVQTPIVDFLLGQDQINARGFKDIVQAVIDKLFKRISGKSVNAEQHDGTFRLITQSSLQSRLLGYKPSSKARVSLERSRMFLEENLIPWVLANPSNFTELKHHDFFFTHLKPNIPTVVDIICDRSISFERESVSVTRATITLSLHRREIPMTTICGPKNTKLQGNINGIISGSLVDAQTKRHNLEKLFRSLAFVNRQKFPELKSSPLVREWERVTGLEW